MMDYTRYTVEDFVLDGNFRRWILAPDVETNRFWQDWLEKHPDKLAELQEARAIILSIPRVEYGWNDAVENQVWQRIVDEIKTHSSDETGDERERKPSIPLHPDAVLGRVSDRKNRGTRFHAVMWGMAASLVLALTAVLGYFQFFHRVSDDLARARPQVYDVPPGAKANFTLSDGTRVFLNGGSRIIYPESFSADERTIEIEGEAFLEVAKDPQRPFTVKTGTLTTEALGTAFNVRNDGTAVEVALVEGAVRVTSAPKGLDERSVILAPGSRALLAEDGVLLTSEFDIDEVTAWTRNILAFNRASEQEVIRRLEQWYGVVISTHGVPSQPWKYSGRFEDKNLEFVLSSMSYAMGFSFEVQDRNVVIYYP